MKRILIVTFFLIASLGTICEAGMNDYCSYPPYVTRTVKPNILVLMDNSQVMRGQAYSAAYSSSSTYDGYFRSALKYYYDGSRWVPSNDSVSHPNLFSGNLLNWATTSQYDLLQKVLVGGKSTSRQTNINTLVSESGSWSKTYSSCIFNIDGGNLQITETAAGACALLASPAGWLASNEAGTRVYFALSDVSPFLGKLWNAVANAALSTKVYLAELADHLGSAAFAAKPLRISTTSLSDIIYNQPYSVSVTGEGGSGESYTWSITSGALPSGITIDSSGTPTTTISSGGSNVTASTGDYTFTVQVRDSAGSTTTKSYTVTVKSAGGVGVSSNYNVRVCVGDYTSNCTTTSSGLKSGIIDEFWDEARFGLEDFNQVASTISAEIANCIPASPKDSFLTGIENATPVGSASLLTPLVDGAYTAVDYYKNNTAANCDPFANSYTCTKNFLLFITAGEGANLGSNVFTDATNCGSYTYNLSKNTCYGFKNDLRGSIAGTQNVSTFIVNTMGSYSTILRNASGAGGGKFYNVAQATNLQAQLEKAFTDILAQAASGTAVSVLTTSSRGVGSMVQAYFLPSVLEGTREVEWTGYLQSLWIDPQDNLREDTYDSLKLVLDTVSTSGAGDKILKLFFDNVANETRAAVFNSGSDGTLTEANCTSATIKPFSEVKYLWEAGKKLAMEKDATARRIITSTTVRRFNNTTTVTTTLPDNVFSVDNVVNNTAGPLATALNGSTTSSDPYYVGKIARYVRGECLETGGVNDCTGTVDSTYRDRRIKINNVYRVWKLGDIVSSTPKVLASTALNTYHFDYGDSSYYSFVNGSTYKQRSSVAFVGGNDGMLHAFRVGYLKDKTDANGSLADGVKALFRNLFGSADTAVNQLGEEIWGFIPYNAFPYLKYLADPDYCHIYFNDLSVRLVDVNLAVNPNDNSSTSAQWRTILIGGMRFGGAPTNGTPTPPMSGLGYSVYYAIDVTNPEDPTPLWEFSERDMGYTTGFPSIIRTGAPTKNGNWYLVFGTGSNTLPKTGQDINRTTTGYLYVLDLKTGNLLKKLDLGHNAIVGDVLAIDADKNYQPEKLYFGTAYPSGSLPTLSWHGKIMRLNIPADMTQLCGSSSINRSYADCATSTSSLVTLFTGDYPFTASPDVTKDTSGNIWLYAGSGKYFSDRDETDNSTQIFLGLKDQGASRTTADLVNRTGFTVTGAVSATTQVCGYDQTTRNFTYQTIVTSISPDSGSIASVPAVGWYVLLGTGEKMISRPLVAGGVVDFLTYIPSSDPCAYGGDSNLYALDYITGAAPATVAIRAPGATSDTDDNITVYSKISLGHGAPPTGEAIIIPPPKEGQELLKKKIQVATGVIVEAVNQPTISVISKFLHWLRK